MASSSTSRPPITCHILDTTTGTPAPNVHCTLTLIKGLGQYGKTIYEAETNSDGRVTGWAPSRSANYGLKPLESVLHKTQEMHWQITFETGAYYRKMRVTPFFDKVDVHFCTGGKGQEDREHYHVPLLVGPFNYTTYRGS